MHVKAGIFLGKFTSSVLDQSSISDGSTMIINLCMSIKLILKSFKCTVKKLLSCKKETTYVREKLSGVDIIHLIDGDNNILDMAFLYLVVHQN